MYLLSKKISEFIKLKTGFSDTLWLEMQADYLLMIEQYLEAEVNLYLENNNLEEERGRLLDISNSDETGEKISNEFWKFYGDHEEVKERVDEHIRRINETQLAFFTQSLSEESRKQFIELIDSEIEKYSKASQFHKEHAEEPLSET